MSVEKARLIKVASRSENSRIAVIFVHGIGGDPYDTWRKDLQSETLIELLERDELLASAEFYSYGYRTGIKPLQYPFKTIAELLYADIQVTLPGKGIVFVAHSMGGLVVQQYIVNRFDSFDSGNLRMIKGAVYLSVPFHGSGLAEIFPKWLVNKQIQSLRRKNPELAQLEESWNKYVYRGGTPVLPNDIKHEISQIGLRGERDRIVMKASSTPLYLGGGTVAVDESHSSICKVGRDSVVYKTIRNFLQKVAETQAVKDEAAVLHIHGFDMQQYEEQSHVELNWTAFFDVYSSPRKLPAADEWREMARQLEDASAYWSQNRLASKDVIRIYAKLCLPGGILVGSRFSQTRGAIIEVVQGDRIWSSERHDPAFKASIQRSAGNDTRSGRAIVVLSVSSDIKSAVSQYLQQTGMRYKQLIHVLPEIGVGQQSLAGGEQAVSYAREVKAVADGLKSSGIEEIALFLNCPFGAAVFVGHYLTAAGPVQLFDYSQPGYVPACVIG